MGLRFGLVALLLLFFLICLFLPILSILKIFAILCSGTIESGILKLGIFVENELLLHYGIYKWAHCFFLPFIYPLFSFSAVFYESVQATVFKHDIHTENEGLYCGIETQAHSSCFSIFLSFPVLHVNIENLCNSFLMNRFN